MLTEIQKKRKKYYEKVKETKTKITHSKFDHIENLDDDKKAEAYKILYETEKNKYKKLMSYIIENKRSQYNLAILYNLNDDIKFLKLLYCSDQTQFINVFENGTYKKSNYYLIDEKAVMIFQCQNINDNYFNEIFESEFQAPIPFFDLYNACIDAINFYSVTSLTQHVFLPELEIWKIKDKDLKKLRRKKRETKT